MAIPFEVIDDFPTRLRERGADYFSGGKVRITRSSPEAIVAEVDGKQTYIVEIDRATDDYDYRCTCPYSSEWDMPCKHIWATLLAADQGGLLAVAGDGEANGQPQDESAAPEPKQPAWRMTLRQLRERALRSQNDTVAAADNSPIPDDRRIIYIIDVPATLANSSGLVVEPMTQKWRARDQTWERPRAFGFGIEQWLKTRDPIDRTIAQMLVGAQDEYGYSGSSTGRRFTIGESSFETLLKQICQTGRCGVRRSDIDDDFIPVTWDGDQPFEFVIEMAPRSDGERVELRGCFRRGEEILSIDAPKMVHPSGLLMIENRLARFDAGSIALLGTLNHAPIHAAITQADDLLAELSALPRLPRIELHSSIQIEQVNVAPRPRVVFRKPRVANADNLLVEVSFDYAGKVIEQSEPAGAVFNREQRKLMRRDMNEEDRAVGLLKALGVRTGWIGSTPALQLPTKQLHSAVMELIAKGWDVHAEGSIYRRPGAVRVSVGSGIDWFELTGGVEFDGKLVPLPRLLAAVRRGESTVKLDDGSIGLLPLEWLAKYAPIAGMGADDRAREDDLSIRFSRVQVGLLDALLATMPDANIDESFASARRQLTGFDRVDPVDAPAGFVGTLRPYQRDGLGWLLFLQKFRFGGCLADDMGLGKTVQVLALLESRRAMRERGEAVGPSLVVVPRSLVFNWMNEAQRFAPKIRILDHSGINRTRAADHFSQFDLIITTYGTLRRDAMFFKETTFDYVILDEAQAIKNATTEAAKATRLLRASHRLALSGTPIENRLTELWSLFEFLNPGMLGGLSVFQSLVGNGQELEGRKLLSRALRPFILRRTKAQVAKELPEKLEQTIHCDLEPPQRKLYDELREHYRQSLLGQIDSVGLNRSKIQILEALLRLRQAACHPGLIDKSRADEPSAKLEALLEHLGDILAEGHKALVFSQFTSLLALVRKRLDDAGIVYEYLDGKTRDRQERVERFQTDDSCKLFLISLKAGGLGLNLTAADYVFLLDPWWNPAVEAQAIDRTHRIGQTRRVFAYRLIARDTVEEKVLQLQQTKRDLADAIITADNSVIGSLKREDLELLLS